MAVPSTQKAGVLKTVGQPTVVEERAVPTPGPKDLLIRITATAINPVDWKFRDGSFGLVGEAPQVLGSDAAGEVAAAGAEAAAAAGWRAGDRVFFQGRVGHSDLSTFQQYCVCPAAIAGRTPAAIPDDAAAAGLSLASICAATMLHADEGAGVAFPSSAPGEGDPAPARGRAALVLGGSSSVGQYCIQLARLAGFSRIVASASAAHLPLLRDLGATAALDRHAAAPADYAAALGGQPLDVVLDGVSTEDSQNLGVEVWKAADDAAAAATTGEGAEKSSSGWLPHRRHVAVWFPFDSAKRRAEAAGIEIPFVLGLGHDERLRPVSEAFYAAAGGEAGWLARGLYRPNRVRVVPGGLAGLHEALELNKKGLSGEKVVIRPQETA